MPAGGSHPALARDLRARLRRRTAGTDRWGPWPTSSTFVHRPPRADGPSWCQAIVWPMLPPRSDDGAVVVTGASSGIGEQIAREFARRGYRLVLVARRADRLRDLAEELGWLAHVLPVDLSNRDERANLPGQVAALGVVADVLINNAGLATLGSGAGSDPQAELNLVEVDVAAVVDLCSRFG